MKDNRFLWNFCTAPMSACVKAQLNCNQCTYKEEAEENKRQRKPVRPVGDARVSKEKEQRH